MGTPYGQQPPAAATCARCGAQIDPTQRFCPACGQPTTGVAWQAGPTYQPGADAVRSSGPMMPPSQPLQAPGQTSPPMMPATPAGGYHPAPSSPLNAPYGQPPTYPPTVAATPQPIGGDPGNPPYTWTNPLQPPYAAGQQPPYIAGQQAPTTGAPYMPGQTTYQAPGYQTPVSAPGQYYPTYQSPGTAAPQRKPRGKLIAVISAICIIAVLGTGAVFAYNIFASHTENQAAKVLPGSSFGYFALDLVALANNSHHISLTDALNSGGASGQDIFRAVGLSFQSDIQPWLDRDVAFAFFQKDASASATTSINQPLGSLGGVMMLQSHNDSAAQSAMAKAANYLRNQGASITNSTYSSVPLYSVQTGDGSASPAVTFGAGKGWALIALDTASAQMVIDRIDGKGDTLADNSAFQSATNDLPSNRFATLYVNLKAVLDAVTRGSSVNLPFINTYPIAVGYTSWTDAGLRSQIALKGNANVGNIAGDTKSLAGLVPAGAVGYIGVANLAGLYQAASRLAGTTADPTQSEFGISATDPALQQPAAFAYLSANGENSQLVYLHVADTGTAQNLIQALANAHHWTAKKTTLAGQAVTAFYDESYGSFLGHDYGYDGSSGPYLAGYATVVRNTLVTTGTDSAMRAVLQTAQGGPSLAQDTTFSQLASAAPSGAALTGYINLAGIASTLNPNAGALASQTTALLLTGIWDDSQLQLTTDTKMR